MLRRRHTAIRFVGIVSTVVNSITSFPWHQTSSISTTFSNGRTRCKECKQTKVMSCLGKQCSQR